MEPFKCYNYFEDIHARLNTLQSFQFGRVNDKNTLESVIKNARTANAFFCIDDSEDGQIMPFAGGFAERKVYFVWILQKYTKNKQAEALNQCRDIYRDLVSRIIHDRDNFLSGLTYVSDRFPFWEMQSLIFPDCTG